MFANLTHCPDFTDLENSTPVMDLDASSPPGGGRRTVDGRRDVEEWGLKVQKLASVHSVTLLFVSKDVIAKKMSFALIENYRVRP